MEYIGQRDFVHLWDPATPIAKIKDRTLYFKSDTGSSLGTVVKYMPIQNYRFSIALNEQNYIAVH